LTDVRLRTARRVLWLRALWAGSRYSGESAMAISHSEVDRTVSPASELAVAEHRFYREDPAAASLSDALDRLQDAAPDLRWHHLVRTLSLTEADANLLALALAAEAIPGMRRVYGYLNDSTAAADASAALARTLWDWPLGTRVDGTSALVRWQAAWPSGSDPTLCSISTEWVADPLVLAELAEDDLAAASCRLGRDVEPARGPVV